MFFFLKKDTPEHHSADRAKEKKKVDTGSGQRSTFKHRERSVFSHPIFGIVSRASVKRLLRNGMESPRAFPSTTMPSWAKAKTDNAKFSTKRVTSQQPIVCVWCCLLWFRKIYSDRF